MNVRRRSIAAGIALLPAFASPAWSQQPNRLVVALHPPEDAREIVKQTEEMLALLSKNLRMEVKSFVASDYNGVIEALRAGRADVGYVGPFAYVLATTVADVEAFAVAESKKSGKVAYHSLIISNKQTGITRPEDLKGRTFAFTDPGSTSGYMFPSAGLLKMGIDPEKAFSRVVFSGSHDNNGLSVQNNRVDAAVIADTIFERMAQKGLVNKDQINVVWKSDPIPESPMVWRKALPNDLKARIRAAFLQVKDVPWSYHGMINGFHPITDADYDVVRDTAKRLKLDLRKVK